MSEDLCPMCNGSGKHHLRPPNGEIYRVLTIIETDPDVSVEAYWKMLQRTINASAVEGYEVQQIADGRGYTAVLMKWRWL